MRWISSLIVPCVFFFSTAALATDFCEARTPGTLAATIARISTEGGMRLAFKNAGGVFNGGVCWWHSRFQRAAWYLARFDAGAPRPTRAEAGKLIAALVARKSVVTIPGYRDLSAFSREFRAEIQSALNAWQIRDGVINQAYLRGLRGKSRFTDPLAMHRHLDSLYATYAREAAVGEVTWIMLQMPGIVSHASLLQRMEPTAEGGYRFAMVDSNFPATLVEYVYRPGDLELSPTIWTRRPYTSVPYSGFQRDFDRIQGALARYCGWARSMYPIDSIDEIE